MVCLVWLEEADGLLPDVSSCLLLESGSGIVLCGEDILRGSRVLLGI